MKFVDKMNIEQEINRLQDLMSASGRILCRIISKPQQKEVITTVFPLPWRSKRRPIYINFDLWRQLSIPQRDLLLLRAMALSLAVKWFKVDLYRGIVLASMLGLAFQLTQSDVVGTVVSGTLGAIALKQIWQENRSLEREIDGDEGGIKVALRRGYSEQEAVSSLLHGIEKVASLEGDRGLNFVELMRIQNLKKFRM